jgi:hypothetical protein
LNITLPATVIGAIFVGLVATACDRGDAAAPAPVAPPAQSAPATVTSPSAPIGTTTAKPAPPKAPAAKPPAAKPVQKGPNRVVTAQLVGYDTTHRMIQFRYLYADESPDRQTFYSYDLEDSATHRVPLAAKVDIAGIGNGGSQICQAKNVTGVAHCTADQLVALLKRGPANPLIVQLVMTPGEEVVTVAEQIGALM